MGYYTRFELTHDAPDQYDAIEDALVEIGSYGEGMRYVLLGEADDMKWYDWKKEMRALSERFPDVLFTLRGEGEESGDLWKAYFKGGKVQVVRAQVTFAPFQEALLS